MLSLQFAQIRSLEAIHKLFEEFPGAFMRALHVPLTNRTSDTSHQTVDKKNKVDAAHFAPFWNQIIKSLREEDYITDFEMELLLMPKNSGRLELVQWPLFLLSSKILLAKEIAAESNSQEEILERIERDDYMKYAVEEVYHTLKLVLTETLEAEGRLWVERIYEDIQTSLKERNIHHDFQLNKLSLVITRVTALLGILVFALPLLIIVRNAFI
jgi:callose synthase